jgi:hypothetical protein
VRLRWGRAAVRHRREAGVRVPWRPCGAGRGWGPGGVGEVRGAKRPGDRAAPAWVEAGQAAMRHRRGPRGCAGVRRRRGGARPCCLRRRRGTRVRAGVQPVQLSGESGRERTGEGAGTGRVMYDQSKGPTYWCGEAE